MKVTKESIESFTVEFESDEELRHEFEANLSAGGLFLSSTDSVLSISLKATEVKRNLLGRQGWLQLIRPGIVDYDSELYVSLYDK